MKKFFYFFIAAVALILTCCTTEQSNSLTDSTPQEASVFLTDGPLCPRPNPLIQDKWHRYFSVNLDVIGIQYFAKDSLGQDSVWKAANFQETTVKVSALANGDSILLTKLSLPANLKVHKIKFLLGKNSYVTLCDSTTKKLIIPSKADSSIVIPVRESPSSKKFAIMLDFDIVHSIVMINNNFYLVPVMRGFIMDECASIAGFVSPEKLATKVFVVNGLDTLATVSDTIRHNFFKLSGFHDGQYTVQFMPLTDTKVTVTRTVTVKKRAVTDLGVVKVN